MPISSTPRPYVAGLICALLGSVAFSAKAIFVKLAYEYNVDALTLLVLRMIFALPIFVAISVWSSKGKAPISRQDLARVICLGFIGYYLSSYLDFAGLKYIPAALERLIFYQCPIMVLLLRWVTSKRSLQPSELIGTGISYAGIGLVFGSELSLGGSHTALGSGLVFASAACYALYLFYSGSFVQRVGTMRLVGFATTAACVFSITHYLIQRPLTEALAVAPQVLVLSLLNAVFGTALPITLTMMAIERIGAGMTAQIGLLGPISTIGLSFIWLNEKPTVWTIVGSAVVLVGVYLFTRAVQPARFADKP